jgi:Mrp family chromosome partitioning ATPase
MDRIPAVSTPLTLRDYLVPIKERRWLILAIVIVITAAVSVYQSGRPKTYTASTKIYVGQNGGTTGGFASPIGIANQAILLTSTNVATKVAKKLGYTGSPAGLASSVTATPSATTSFITITAGASSAGQAVRVANAFAQEFITQNSAQQQAANNQQIAALRQELKGLGGPSNAALRQNDLAQIQQLQLANSTAVGAATQVDPAQGASASGHPLLEYGLLAAIAALVGSCLLAYMLHRLDPRLKSVEQAAQIYSLPVLATVGHDNDINLFHDERPGLSQRSRESFRDLRVALDTAAGGEPIKTVLVTSAGAGEGKSTVARNLGLTFAEAGLRVALFDADLRKGSLAGRLGAETRPGLTDVLAGLNTLEDVKTVVDVATITIPGVEKMVNRLGQVPPEFAGAGASVTVFPAGTPPANPPAVVESKGFHDLLERVSADFDVVVIDTTPITAVSDAIPLLRIVNVALVVARIDKTDRRTARFANELMGRVSEANLAGLVVNDLGAGEAAAYGYAYGYGYGYGYGHKSQRANGAAPELAPRDATKS